jgi:signal transduction histidine kinase
MGAAPLPDDERKRLTALRDMEILDTAAEEAFDRFTRLAANLLGVPIALVSLIDEFRQWFKSRHGLEAEETPRDWAFCAHAILDDAILVVDDARLDPRFADNPLVTGAPDIRFYAGAPLRTRDNIKIGTLCVIDREPRDGLSPEHSAILADLADAVVNQIYLHKVSMELDHARKAQAQFVANVSHELRTPLTSIKGSLGLVRAGACGPLPEAAQSMVDMAYSNSERLIRLINDLLDAEKMESGKMEFRLEPVELAGLLRQAVSDNNGYAASFNASLHLVEPLPALTVEADRDRLLQVMANLISNAVKFSPAEGQVSIALASRNGEARVTVTDRGGGIPEAFRGRIFQKFSQASGTAKGGTGLGLNICRAIVEHLGGTIGFDSETGVGTTFYFALPLAREGA